MANIPIIGGLFGGGQEPMPEEKAVGGKVKGKYANGGWISGPMSGYPVSLDGGATTSFIGHGTEWVGRRAAGGDAFVIPFNTPATNGKNGLTAMRMQQQKQVDMVSLDSPKAVWRRTKDDVMDLRKRIV